MLIKQTTLWPLLTIDQQDAVEKLDNVKLGRCSAPTGIGKTMIEAALIVEDILQRKNQSLPPGLYTVSSPIKLLDQQLLETIISIIYSCDIEIDAMLINSDNIKSGQKSLSKLQKSYKSKIGKALIIYDSSTNSTIIEKNITESFYRNRPLLTVINYRSSKKLTGAITNYNINNNTDLKISCLINDEAHFLVSERHKNYVAEDYENSNISDEDLNNMGYLPYERMYSFTATEKYTGPDKVNGGTGMGNNNSDKYGELIVDYSITDAIKNGYITKPWYGTLLTSYKNGPNPDKPEEIGNFIYNTTMRASEKLKKECNQNLRMLIATSGSKSMLNFSKSAEYTKLINDGYNIAMLSSNKEVGYQMEGNDFKNSKHYPKNKKVTKNIFLKVLNDDEIKDSKIIILHHNIFTVGIDVEGLNCLLLMYYRDLSYFYQNLGRILRLSSIDRNNLKNGTIIVPPLDDFNNTCNWEKPYAMLLVPDFLIEVDSKIQEIIKDLYNNDLVTHENIIEVDIKGASNTNQENKKTKKSTTKITKIFDDLNINNKIMSALTEGYIDLS